MVFALTRRSQATTVRRLIVAAVRRGETYIERFIDPGTFQQYAIAPANYVTPIPEALSSEDAAPMLSTFFEATTYTSYWQYFWVVWADLVILQTT